MIDPRELATNWNVPAIPGAAIAALIAYRAHQETDTEEIDHVQDQ